MHLKISENKDCIYIDAKDITALRASANATPCEFQVIGGVAAIPQNQNKSKNI